MIDDLLSIKAAAVGRCVSRVHEEYARVPNTFADDQPAQDAAIPKIARAGDAALDMGQHLIHRERLDVPQNARDALALLVQSGWISTVLAERLKRMADFRNIAVHDHLELQSPIMVALIENHLDFRRPTSPFKASTGDDKPSKNPSKKFTTN